MTSTPEPRDFQAEVLNRLERLDQKLDADIHRQDTCMDKLDTRMNQWKERFLQPSRDNLAISRTVIIATATVVILGSLLDRADVLVEGAARLLGK